MITGKDGRTYYKVALHIHTTDSDGKNTKSEVVDEYRSRGYDAIAFTDHWRVDLGGMTDGMLIIPGCEYNTGAAETMTEGVMHILGLGMKTDPETPRDATRQQIVDGITTCGGIAVLAHPAWSLNTVADIQELHGIEATEIYNAVSEAHESLRAYSDEYVDLVANAKIYPKLLATDDAHFYDGSDTCRGYVMVCAEALTSDAIISAIRNGDFFASQGPELYARREGDKIIIDTSPCSIISALSNLSWASERTARGENVCHFEYKIKPLDRWVRIEARDADGKRAWSNIFVI